MTDAHGTASTLNSKFIKATPEALYRAFTDPTALAVWLVPGVIAIGRLSHLLSDDTSRLHHSSNGFCNRLEE